MEGYHLGKKRLDVKTAIRLRETLKGHKYIIEAEDYRVSTSNHKGFLCEGMEINSELEMIGCYFRNGIPNKKHHFGIRKLENGGLVLELKILGNDSDAGLGLINIIKSFFDLN